MTSRGCPYRCTYCMNHQLRQVYKDLGPYIRRRSPDHVIKELIWAKKRYNFKEVYFYDDIFSTDEKWLQEFRDKLAESGLKLKYKCLVSANYINENIVKLLKQSGCIDIDIGVESGSARVREKIFNRYMSNEQILKATSIIKRYGIRVSTLNIINNPTETPKDMMDTFNLNHQIRPSGALVTSLYPFPNTAIFKMCEDEGLIDENTLNAVMEGHESYRKDIIFNHPYKDIGKKIQIFLPLFIKLPRWTHRFLLKMPPLKVFRVLTIPLLTSFHNGGVKIREFTKMILTSRNYYRNY